MIARICPQARVIDITHGIPRHDVRAGAIVLADALPYMPAACTWRSSTPTSAPSAGRSRSRWPTAGVLVGPDNGLLLAGRGSAGASCEAVDIARSPLRLEPVSATFHGRDIFAPVAAHLAAGAPLAEAGDPLRPADAGRARAAAARASATGRSSPTCSTSTVRQLQLDAGHDDCADRAAARRAGRARAAAGDASRRLASSARSPTRRRAS